MSLKEANSLFQKKHYQQALDIYNRLLSTDPVLYASLKFNIAHCKSRLVKKVEVEPNQEVVVAVKKLLTTDILAVKKEKKLPPLADIKHLLSSVDAANEFNVAAVLRCGLSSPFQRKLAQHIVGFLNRLGFANLLRESASGSNYASVLMLAADSGYWLMHRAELGEKLEPLITFDSRVADLLANGSSDAQRNISWKSKSPHESVPNELVKGVSVAFGTILLNEQKFIGLNLYQHYMLCDNWVLVEGTCLGYPTRKVTDGGLSKDHSSTIIEIFPDPCNRLQYVKYGWTNCGGEDAKSELRNEYLKRISEDALVVIDADEFYLKENLAAGVTELYAKEKHAVILPQVHFWKNTSQYITGEYYDISHTRIYRNINGMKYVRNHNFPELNQKFTYETGQFKFQRTQVEKEDGFFYKEPCCFHMGFAKDFDDMRDKSDYYINRGENVTRKATTESRAAWFSEELPEKCRVRKWAGLLPEVLAEIGA